MKKRFVSLVTVLAMLCTVIVLPTAASAASDTLKLGDYVQMGTYYGEPILWRVVSFEKISGYDDGGNPIIDSTDTVTEYKEGYLPLLLSDKIICLKAFDAPTSVNSVTGSHSRDIYRGTCGSDDWYDSNIRSWLNSSESTGNVEWLCGNPPSEEYIYAGDNDYDNEAGFLTNFTLSEIGAMQTAVMKSLVGYGEWSNSVYDMGTAHFIYNRTISDVVQNYSTAYAQWVTDSIFLLDAMQVNTVYNNSSVLGSSYYIGEPTVGCVSNSENTSTLLKAGSKWKYWLRTPYADEYGSFINLPFNSTRFVDSSGNIYSSSTYMGIIGIRPAFYFNIEMNSLLIGSGTSDAPYRIVDAIINNYGVAYAYFQLNKPNGDPLKNTTVSYKIDGYSGVYTAATDDDGMVQVQSPYLEGSDETVTLTCKFTGADLEKSEYSFDVYLSPLTYTQTWKGKVSGDLGISVGFGAGGSIGYVEGEATLASVGPQGSLAVTLTVADEYSDGKRSLTLSETLDNALALKAKAGLFAKADLSSAKFDLSAVDISVKGGLGTSDEVSLKIDDYDPSNSEQAYQAAGFLLDVMTSDSNVLVRKLCELWDAEYNEAAMSMNLKLSVGAKLGSIDVGVIDADIASLSGDGLFSGGYGYDKNGKTNYSTSVTADAGVKLGRLTYEISKSKNEYGGTTKAGHSVDLFTKDFINNKISIKVTNSEGTPEKITFSTLADNDNSSLLWGETNKNLYKKITFTDESAQNIIASNEKLTALSGGSQLIFKASKLVDAMSDALNSGEDGTYKYEDQHKTGIDVGLSLGIKAGLGFDAGIGFSGKEEVSYETENGKLEDGRFYVLSNSEVDSRVSKSEKSLAEVLNEPMKTLAQNIMSMLTSVTDKVINAVRNDFAEIKGTVSDWFCTITTLNSDSDASLQSYKVLAVGDEASLFETSSLATTVGDAYVISVTDTDGNEIDDYTDNPLTLTISYTEDMLTAADVDDESQIKIYYWDSSKSAYVCMGGTLDSENKSVTLDITQPGQYILAVDDCPPAVTEMEYANTSGYPTISATVADMSGIAEFELSIDDEVVVDSDSFADYYYAPTAEFEYTSPVKLSNGEHTAKITAADTSGNAMEEPEYLVFTVDNTAPEIISVEIPAYVTDGTLSVSAKVSDDNLSGVYAYVNYNDGVYTYELIEGDTGWYADINTLPDFAELDVWIAAYDESGNSAESAHSTTLAANSQSGTSIGASSTGDNDVQIFISSDSAITGRIMLGEYNEYDQCIGVQMVEYKTSNTIDKIDFSVSDECYKVKAFLWSDIDNMQPICESYSVIV